MYHKVNEDKVGTMKCHLSQNVVTVPPSVKCDVNSSRETQVNYKHIRSVILKHDVVETAFVWCNENEIC